MTYFQSKLFLKRSKTFKCCPDNQYYFTVKLVDSGTSTNVYSDLEVIIKKMRISTPKNETFSVSCLKIYTTSRVGNRPHCFSIVGKQRKEVPAEIYRYRVFVT